MTPVVEPDRKWQKIYHLHCRFFLRDSLSILPSVVEYVVQDVQAADNKELPDSSKKQKVKVVPERRTEETWRGYKYLLREGEEKQKSTPGLRNVREGWKMFRRLNSRPSE